MIFDWEQFRSFSTLFPFIARTFSLIWVLVQFNRFISSVFLVLCFFLFWFFISISRNSIKIFLRFFLRTLSMADKKFIGYKKNRWGGGGNAKSKSVWLLLALVVHAQKFYFKVDDSVKWINSRVISRSLCLFISLSLALAFPAKWWILPFFLWAMQALLIFHLCCASKLSFF